MDNETLQAAISTWREWPADLQSAPTCLRQLAGKSNTNYLVASDEAQFVVRLNADSRILGVDRETEAQVLSDISGQPFSPDVVFSNDQFMVTRYVAGAHAGLLDIDKMGRLFKVIHATPTSVSRSLSPWHHAADYLAQLPSVDPRLAACHDYLGEVLGKPVTTCLCHNDLLNENVIIGDGVTAIDWEYARMGDPAFDLAVYAETYSLDEPQFAQLLSNYGDESDALVERITRNRQLYALIELLWHTLRSSQQGPGELAVSALLRRLDLAL